MVGMVNCKCRGNGPKFLIWIIMHSTFQGFGVIPTLPRVYKSFEKKIGRPPYYSIVCCSKDSFITQDRNEDFEGGQVESTFSRGHSVTSPVAQFQKNGCQMKDMGVLTFHRYPKSLCISHGLDTTIQQSWAIF